MISASYSIFGVPEVRLLTVDETRSRLGGVCRNTLRKLEKDEELIPWRIEKRVFYRSIDVDRYLIGDDLANTTGSLIPHLQFLVSSEGSVYGLQIGSSG